MIVVLGFWALAMGYSLVYTGVEWFTTGKGSLAENLGLPALIGTTPPPGTQTAATNPSNPAASGLAFWSGSPSAAPVPSTATTPTQPSPGTQYA